MAEEAKNAMISEKWQVVIPQKIRKELKVKPCSKLLMYGKDGVIIIMKVMKLPNMKKNGRKSLGLWIARASDE